ncbi:hypothetical protein D3C77_581880 [compost metagenome]
MVHRSVGENPHQPGGNQGAAQAEQAHRHFMAFSFGKANQREAPDSQSQFDEYQPDNHVYQGVAEVAQAFAIHGLTAIGALRLEAMAAYQTVDDHAQDHQHGAHQRLT